MEHDKVYNVYDSLILVSAIQIDHLVVFQDSTWLRKGKVHPDHMCLIVSYISFLTKLDDSSNSKLPQKPNDTLTQHTKKVPSV